MKSRVSAVGFALLLVLALVAPASAVGGGVWHRLNPDPDNPSAEHERLACVERVSALACTYDKVQEPGYGWNATTGHFHGRDVTATWECPEWFGDLCGDVVAVYSGRATYFPDDGTPFTLLQMYVVTETSGGQEVLYQYWVGPGFACPWFRTFAEALAANPTASLDCLVAP